MKVWLCKEKNRFRLRVTLWCDVSVQKALLMFYQEVQCYMYFECLNL